MRRLQIRVPGGKTVQHYAKRKPAGARCGSCGSALKGTPRERPLKMRKLALTMKRPERPYGGNLCSKCMRSLIIGKARSQ